MISEAIAAVHRLIAARLERNLGLLAAIRADRGEHLALRTSAAVLGAVDWRIVVSASALAGLLSLLTSIAGLPEVPDCDGDGIPDDVDDD